MHHLQQNVVLFTNDQECFKKLYNFGPKITKEVRYFLTSNRPYSRWLFPTYPELLRCQIQAGHSELVSLTHILPRDLVSCAVCVQAITGHLTVNSVI